MLIAIAPNGLHSFETLAADKGGDLGGGNLPAGELHTEILDTVLAELKETYTRSAWEGQSAENVKGYIALYVPAGEQTIANTLAISEQLYSLVRMVGKHCQANDEKISAETAVAKIVEAFQLGLVDTQNGAITAVEAFKNFVTHSSSITEEIGRARSTKKTASVTAATVTEATPSVVESPSAPEAKGTSTEISTKVSEFALSVGWTGGFKF